MFNIHIFGKNHHNMKKQIIIIAAILLSAFNSRAQMTLAHTYVGYGNQLCYPTIVSFTNYGKKYAMLQDSATVLLYNTNHTLWKTIAMPVLPNYTVANIWVNIEQGDNVNLIISDKLFNSDNLVEAIGSYFTPGNSHAVLAVINENGVIIDSVSNVPPGNLHGVKVHSLISGAFVLTVPIYTPGVISQTTKVFNLPGTIPCETCSGPLAIQKIEEPQNFGTVSDPIPNPTSGNTKIEYMLPLYVPSGEIDMYDTEGRIVRKYKVTAANTSISIDASELSAGTYYYHLKAGESFTTAKKMLVIK
jgi:Secretion system C-terminal sorting domain